METITLAPHKAQKLQAVLAAANAGTFRHGPELRQVRATEKALLVEPLNETTFIFVSPNTAHLSPSAPGSGTDALRQRIKASLFFDNLS